MTYFQAKFHIPPPNSSLLNAGNHNLKKCLHRNKMSFYNLQKVTSLYEAEIKGPVYSAKDPRLKWPPITLHVLG
jgi:hypothetical protein